MRGRVALLIVCLFGVLFVTSCGGKQRVSIVNAQGKTVGEIQVDSPDEGTILQPDGSERGRVRGTMVRDTKGARVGTVEQRSEHTVITDAKGSDAGTLEKGTDCYGKGKAKLGTVKGEVSVNMAGAACLLLLLPKQ